MFGFLQTIFGLFHTFYIKPSERGILFHRSDFKRILTPGTYRYFGPHWNVQTFDIKQPSVYSQLT